MAERMLTFSRCKVYFSESGKSIKIEATDKFGAL